MKIILAKHSGFCMGVKNAYIKSLNIENKKETVIFGDIVHNKYAIEEIKNSGLEIISDLDHILQNNNIKNVIIRAHGISPEIEKKIKENGKNIIDFTCPIVKKVQLLAKKYSDRGYYIFIFGKDNHPEVIGIKGYCSNGIKVISSMDEIENLNKDITSKNIVLISQTTMNYEDFDKISKKLKEYYPHILIINTLCKNPLKTQEEAINLSKKVDIMIVVGDKKSSNTKSLYERLKILIETHFVEDINDLKNIEFKKNQTIGITGGASTPQSQIEKIASFLKAI